MNDLELVHNTAKSNYKKTSPWPETDVWHSWTKRIINNYVQTTLTSLDLSKEQIILNAGCERTTYESAGTMIYMDIVEEYVRDFDNGLVASVENIPLESSSIDVVICVGSVVNYTDIQKVFSEFSRILVPGGYLILEYERSNSAEFILYKNYAKTVFLKNYHYNKQTHNLFMYDERFVLSLSDYYGFSVVRKHRFHVISSLLYRFGVTENKAAQFSFLDKFTQPISFPFAHNEIILYRKRSRRN